MITYEFYCEKCDTVVEICCPSEHRDDDRECDVCNSLLVRHYGQVPHYWNGCVQPGNEAGADANPVVHRSNSGAVGTRDISVSN